MKRLAEGHSPQPDKRKTSVLVAYTQPYLFGMVGCNAQGTAKAPRHLRAATVAHYASRRIQVETLLICIRVEQLRLLFSYTL